MVAGLMLAGAGLALAGCGQNAASVDDQGRVRLRLALDGPASAAHGGFYQALASGHYERRNLNVEILPGGGEVDVPELLASSAVELAIGADGFAVLSLMMAGAPVRAVAAYFQKDTHALVTRADAPIETLSDLAGRPVILNTPEASTVWPVLAALNGLEPTAGVMPTDDEGLAPFLEDSEAVLLTDLRQGAPVAPFETQTVLLGDQDYPVYGGLLLAPNSFARDNAATLRAFIIASAEGWRDYLAGDPTGANERLTGADPDLTPEALDALRQTLIAHQIVQGGEAAIRGIGVMNADRWRDFAVAAVEAGVAPPGLEGRDAFTLDYLPGRN